MMRSLLVAVALAGAVLSGCGGTEQEAQEAQALVSTESALEHCLWFRGVSPYSYADACEKAVVDGRHYCDTYAGGVKSISRTCVAVTNAEPYTADKYICCNGGGTPPPVEELE